MNLHRAWRILDDLVHEAPATPGSPEFLDYVDRQAAEYLAGRAVWVTPAVMAEEQQEWAQVRAWAQDLEQPAIQMARTVAVPAILSELFEGAKAAAADILGEGLEAVRRGEVAGYQAARQQLEGIKRLWGDTGSTTGMPASVREAAEAAMDAAGHLVEELDRSANAEGLTLKGP